MASARPLFTTLPAEIYDNIFEESWRIHGLESLRCLRLVSRHFAYLPSVLRQLFQKMVLPVSPESPTDLSAIAPHVKHLSFQPAGYSWAMDLDTYRQILFLEPMRKCCHELNREWTRARGSRYVTTGDVSPLTFARYYMGNEPPYTEAEVASRYSEYMCQAEKMKGMFDSGAFARSWTQAMRRTTGAGIVVETRAWRFGSDHRHDLAWVEGDGAHTPETCMEIHGVVGETLMDTVLACAADAGVRVRSLNVYHCVRGRSRESFAWVYDGRLDGVDLQGLSFDPVRTRVVRHDRYEAVRRVPVDTDPGEQVLAEVLTVLLSDVAPKLRRLELFLSQLPHYEYHSHCAHWPSCHVRHEGLPLLMPFLSPANVFTGGLRGLIREARNLTYLHVDFSVTKKVFNGQSSWRRFWRAIRYHPSRMLLDMRYEPRFHRRRHIKHYTGDDSKSEPGSVNHSLEMYLSNRGPWDTLCRGSCRGGETELEDTDDEEKEYWEGKSERQTWVD